MTIPAESFVLTPGAGGSLQQQIRAMVAEGILSGRFRAGERMPSSRGLAAHLGLSRITVTLAYAELVAQDWLTARGRSGYFVSDTAPGQPEVAAQAAQGVEAVDYGALAGHRFSQAVSVSKPADWRSYPYPFIYGQADATLFDHQNWRLCAIRALGKRDFEALTDDWQERDDPLLIEYIRRNILPRRGIAAREGEVLITMGAQNGLWLAAQVLLGPGRRAVLENPVYPGLRAILQQTRCRCVRSMSMPKVCRPTGCHAISTWSSPPPATTARPTRPCRSRAVSRCWRRRRGAISWWWRTITSSR